LIHEASESSEDLTLDLTVVIAASYIPSHPSTRMIEQTISSLSLLGIGASTPVLIAHDNLPPTATHNQVHDFYEYLDSLNTILQPFPNSKVTLLDEWGQLNSSLRLALSKVVTTFVLICQHDLPFVREVNLAELIGLLSRNPQVKHVRFNLRRNQPYGFDCHPRFRSMYYRQKTFDTGYQESSVSLVRTLGWSDNNHVCRTDYYTNKVFPLVGRRKIAPEHVMNLVVWPFTHHKFGTFIYGPINDPPFLKHLDGKEGASAGYRLPQPIDTVTLRGRIRKTGVQLKVNLLRIFYLSKVLLMNVR
jgi:hypothetical protein